jgi:CHAD domain-containing protein
MTALLTRPAAEVARLLALRQLRDVSEARPGAENPDDPEGLHDFRVSLRRLRSTLRIFRPELKGAVRRRVRRGLRRLARDTNGPRDLQVHAQWVNQQLPGLGPDERDGAKWLVDLLRDRGREQLKPLSRRLRVRFPALRRELARGLSWYRVPVSPEAPATLEPAAGLIARRIEELNQDFLTALDAIHAISDDGRVHQARIAAKRLRYLLEPLVNELDGGESVECLKRFQDILGELHDSQVFSEELETLLQQAGDPTAAPEATPPVHGVVAIQELQRLLQLRGEQAFARLEKERLLAPLGAHGG